MEDISEGSGRELLDIVDSAIRLLRVNPEMAPRYSEKYRRLVLRDGLLLATREWWDGGCSEFDLVTSTETLNEAGEG
ncbi:MAG: hypothetical protein ACC700_20460, partial [Anaerolineales bacterium]